MNSQSNAPSAGDHLARIKAARTALILAALGFAPLLGLFCIISWSRPAYQFFPLAFAAAAALLWRAIHPAGPAESRRPETPKSEVPGPVVSGPGVRSPSEIGPVVRSPSARGPGVLALALSAALLFLLANVLWSPWLGYVAFLFCLATALWSLGGTPLLRAGVPALLILLTILPPPLNGDVTLTVWLRSVAIHTSSVLLDWLQVTHAQDGNTLLLPGKTLLVEEACSGINSFILCNFLCLFWGLWQRRGRLWFLFALLATSLFVVLGNIIRITAGAAAFYFYRVDLLNGRPHEIFGLVLLLAYCVLILSFDQWLVFLTYSSRAQAAAPEAGKRKSEDGRSEIEGTVSSSSSPPAPPPSPAVGSQSSRSLPCALLALIGIGVFAAHLLLGGRHGLAKLPSLASVRELNLSLPAKLAGWQRINGNSGDLTWIQSFGFRTADWQFEHNGLQATVAADYPLDGFHNVKSCYIGNGWRVLAESELLLPPAGPDAHAIKLELQKSLQYALVLHSVIDGEGQWLSAPLTVANRFQEDLGPPRKGYRVQMITVGYGPLSPAVEADCQALFLEARQSLVRQMVDQLHSSASK